MSVVRIIKCTHPVLYGFIAPSKRVENDRSERFLQRLSDESKAIGAGIRRRSVRSVRHLADK